MCSVCKNFATAAFNAIRSTISNSFISLNRLVNAFAVRFWASIWYFAWPSARHNFQTPVDRRKRRRGRAGREWEREKQCECGRRSHTHNEPKALYNYHILWTAHWTIMSANWLTKWCPRVHMLPSRMVAINIRHKGAKKIRLATTCCYRCCSGDAVEVV